MYTLDYLTIALKITQASAIFRPKLIQDPIHSATLVSVLVSEVIDAPNESCCIEYKKGVTLEFEELEEELEEYLQDLVDRAHNDAVNTSCICPEYRELTRLGYIEPISEYIDGTALVRLSYKAMKYNDRKKKWKKDQAVKKVKGVAESAADKATDFVATVISKGIGL